MPEYIRKNRVVAFQVLDIEGCSLIVGDDEDILVTHEWITHEEPKVGGYFVKPPIGPAIYMSPGEFNEEYELYVPPAPPKKKAAKKK